MRSPQFQTYIAPARSRPQIWRLLLGILLCLAVYIAWVAGMLAALWALTGSGGFRGWADTILQGRTAYGTQILLLTFLGMALGPMLAARLLHRRNAGSLFGRGAVVVRDFVIAAGLVALVFGVATALWLLSYDAVPNLDWKVWLTLLPLSLLGLLIQTGAEELVFRGYLQQQLAVRFRSPVLWMVLPSLLFGAVHYDPETAAANVWLMMAAAAAFGLVAADLTAVTGSLGAAWGFHFANNVAAILIVSLDGTLSGLSLFKTPYGADDAQMLPRLIAIDLLVLTFTWALVRRALRR